MSVQSSHQLCRLEVTVIEGRHMGKSVPCYVYLELGGQTLKSAPARTNASGVVQWSDTLILTAPSLKEMYPEKLSIRVMTRDALSTDICIGAVSVPINRIPIAQELDTWFDLEPATVSNGAPRSSTAPPGQLRLGLSLSGELRSEVRALLNALGVYTSAVDQGVERFVETGDRVKPFLATRAAAAAAVPLGLTAVAALPLFIVASPLLLPVIVVAAIGLAVVGAILGVLALSSKGGRARLMPVVEPVLNKLRSNSVGQQLLYATGPRPSPYAIIKTFAPTEMWHKLAASVAVDAVGCSSYALPFLGEVTDVVWAPVSAVLINTMYSETSPYAAYVGFLEEIFPFTDIIPTATLAWAREYAPELYMMFRERFTGQPSNVEVSPEGVRAR